MLLVFFVNFEYVKVVTVLLGVYSKATGEPIIGVVNQPFHTKSPEQQWTGQIYWGLCYQGRRKIKNV